LALHDGYKALFFECSYNLQGFSISKVALVPDKESSTAGFDTEEDGLCCFGCHDYFEGV
jgi:hypothetical protein